jgi:positive regulator of sigma E activity
MEILPGQFVETGLSGKALFIQALEAFLPPAAGFAGAYLVTAGCFPALGESSRIAAGLVFLAAAAAAFSAFRKHFPPPLPRITRILPEEPRAEE